MLLKKKKFDDAFQFYKELSLPQPLFDQMIDCMNSN